MSIGLIGRKVGMTQVFAEDGTMVPVSVVSIEPNTVTRLRTTERDGYTAVQLGAGTREKQTKPVAGQLRDLPRVATIRGSFDWSDVGSFEQLEKVGVAIPEWVKAARQRLTSSNWRGARLGWRGRGGWRVV